MISGGRGAFGHLRDKTRFAPLETREHEIRRKDGTREITPRAQRTIREEHDRRMRALRSLPLHVVLVASEPVDPKDATLADVSVRLFREGHRFFAEVLKDRTGHTPAGSVIENPRLETWIAAAVYAEPPKDLEKLEALAKELIEHVGEIDNVFHWRNWRRKHARELIELIRVLPEGATKRKLLAIGRAKKKEFEGGRPAFIT